MSAPNMQDVVSSFRPDLFEGKHVLVSGGSSGIGLAMAQGFSALGASVTATGSSEAKLAALRDNPGLSKIKFACLDVRDRVAVPAFIKALPALDVLINARGTARAHIEYDEDTFLEVMDINLNSAMRLAMAGREHLVKSRGVILNISSMLSYLADENVPAYGASKTGILGLTRALAHKLGRDGVRVNAIAPGYHKTAMTQDLWSVPDTAAKIANRSALKRWGSVEDLVGTALFLASPAAAFITAVSLPVDGGYVVGGF